MKVQHTQIYNTLQHFSAYIKKVGKSHTSDLTAQLKAVEQKKVDSPRKSRQQEIIKLRAEITKQKQRKQYEKSMKKRVDYLRKSTKLTNTYQKAEREHLN